MSAEIVWRKSTASNPSGNCVEVADVNEQVWMRDSKNPGGTQLYFSKPEWRAFVASIRAGEFDDLG